MIKELNDIIDSIIPMDESGYNKTEEHLNSIAKPLGSLGGLEDVLKRLGAINALKPDYKPCVIVMCADNGVVCEGVTQTGSEVTANVCGNMTRGESTVCIMAKTAGADVFPFDAGMNVDVLGIKSIKTRYGTGNICKECAMTQEEAIETIIRGANTAFSLIDKGYDLICLGEMGIGNTTTSAAMTAVFTGLDPSVVTGKGAGLSDSGLIRKIEVIRQAINLHKPQKDNPIDVLSKVGGLDIAAMSGVILGCAKRGIPVIIDGFICSVAALVAKKLGCNSKDYMIMSHLSKEPGAEKIVNELGLHPLLSMGMALGEGTGAVTMIPLIRMASAVYYEMPTFSDIGMEAYKKL